jgi:hypothetical protein
MLDCNEMVSGWSREINKMKILTICCLAIVLCSCSPEPSEKIKSPLKDVAFVIESGPEDIGYSAFWVIRHKDTGALFVFVERGSGGGLFLAPLK